MAWQAAHSGRFHFVQSEATEFHPKATIDIPRTLLVRGDAVTIKHISFSSSAYRFVRRVESSQANARRCAVLCCWILCLAESVCMYMVDESVRAFLNDGTDCSFGSFVLPLPSLLSVCRAVYSCGCCWFRYVVEATFCWPCRPDLRCACLLSL